MSFPCFQHPQQIQVTVIHLEMGHQTTAFVLLPTTGGSMWSTLGEGREEKPSWTQPCPHTYPETRVSRISALGSKLIGTLG